MRVYKMALRAFLLGALVASLGLAKEMVSIETKKGTVKVPKNPKKVVVIDYGALDTLDLLGVDVELALPGGIKPSNLAKYKDKALEIGSLFEPNFEKIYEFKPDLIILGGRGVKSYNELSKIAPTLYYLADYNNYTHDTVKMATDLGKVFGKEKEAKEEIEKVNKLIEKTKKMAENSDKKVLFLLTNDGKISAYGKGSRFGYVFNELGFKSVDENIKVSRHGQSVNYEYISEKNPDALLYVDRTAIAGGSQLGGDTLNNKLVLDTKAGKNDKIIPLSSDLWYLSQGGLSAYKVCITELQKALK